MKYFNLPFNDFEGMIPSEGIFKNGSATIVEGNNKLCGGIPCLDDNTESRTKPKPKSKPKGSLNYQIKVMGFGDALLTQGTLENNSNDGLSLSGFNDWSGSGTCPNVTPAKLSLTFCHNADAQGAGSKGGVVYTVGNGGIKWVIAWSNMQNDENKVYVDITDTAVDWSAVKSSLENSSPNPSAVTKNGYTTTATIDANKNLPSFTATLG
ncbi:hypothetical protein GQ457_14G021120 [Hibiscus cannabinus]